MRFESSLAERIASKKDSGRSWKTYASFVAIVFIVLTLTASTLAVPQAVVHLGSKNSVAMYLGQFDSRTNVLLLGVAGVEDWVSVKIPFKGHISDLQSISYSLFVAQAGEQVQLQPYVVLGLPSGRSLIWNPETAYSAGVLGDPTYSWLQKDAVAVGSWALDPAGSEPVLEPLGDWPDAIGDQNVLSIYIFAGNWDLSDPYQCYIGDLAVNGKTVNLANAGRVSGPSSNTPPWL